MSIEIVRDLAEYAVTKDILERRKGMLKELRTSKGLSQKDLSDITGISVRTIQHYEQGRRSIDGASLSTLVILAITLNCRITDLLTDETLISNCNKTSL